MLPFDLEAEARQGEDREPAVSAGDAVRRSGEVALARAEYADAEAVVAFDSVSWLAPSFVEEACDMDTCERACSGEREEAPSVVALTYSLGVEAADGAGDEASSLSSRCPLADCGVLTTSGGDIGLTASGASSRVDIGEGRVGEVVASVVRGVGL